METNKRRDGDIHLGLDIGSISVNTVLINNSKEIVEEHYTRLKGEPCQTVIRVLEDILRCIPQERIISISVTGSGGRLISELLGGEFVNEIVAQARGVMGLYPEARTVIEIGGEDSKLLIFERDGAGMKSSLEDFAMNTICAAGTGSFLDQQANRLGISIEREFGEMALRAKHPPRIAGRCSVFAKSDMIHLQQIGTPDYDIVAGLCYAVARSFKSNMGKGKEFKKPILFQGGVAANIGLIKAFEDILGLDKGELIIPGHYASMGAIGAVFVGMEKGTNGGGRGLDGIKDYLKSRKVTGSGLERLSIEDDGESNIKASPVAPIKGKTGVDIYMGIDVGSLSTNVVVIDRDKNVIARRYLRTGGRPIEAVQRGLREIGEEIGRHINVLGIGTTGSGRYMTGDFAGADVVRNEITAQATAAIHFDMNVDTVFEIGGQDSKYISIQNGTVVDFEMNKVCAAGTGSFLEEQAEKLGIDIENEFGERALRALSPSRLGERCTVFMESDLVSHQQKGYLRDDLVAGLGYSIVYNYLNKVVGDRRIGDNIFFQGGVAWNKAVVTAFKKVTGKRITVPPHHDVTGAIGVAILAMDYRERHNSYVESSFKGFDLSRQRYKVTTFECKRCTNICNISKVKFENESPHFYGARCERFEMDKKKKGEGRDIPDLFAEREKLLVSNYRSSDPADITGQKDRPDMRHSTLTRIGIPRVLLFHEFFPFWNAFFSRLGFEVVLSDMTNRKTIHLSVENVSAETCFPIKIVYGHVLDLLEKDIDILFLPSIIDIKKDGNGSVAGQTCPYVQAIPYLIQSSIDLQKWGGRFLKPAIYFHTMRDMERILIRLGKDIGRSYMKTREAIREAEKAQDDFYRAIKARGREVLENLKKGERGIVIISRSYNGCDSGINLRLPGKLKDLGVITIPMDFLPLDSCDVSARWPDMYWRNGQKILNAAKCVRSHKGLEAIFITNFGCGPDSFIGSFLKKEMGGHPFLQIEIDEHNADAGIITRCEAFLDSLKNCKGNGDNIPKRHGTKKKKVNSSTKRYSRTIYLPYMRDGVFAIAAAFKANGIKAEVLPEPTRGSVEFARRFTTGKECYPLVITLGDFLKKSLEDGFDPERSAFFMPSTDGPCRFGLYTRYHQQILRELGKEGVVFISPNQGRSNDFYGKFDSVHGNFSRLAWQGIVAYETIEKMAREIRPYEINKGETNRVYNRCLKRLYNGIIKRTLIKSLRESLGEMSSIDIERDVRKPIIGIIGEIFIRSNRFSNSNVIEEIERLGGEVWMPSVIEWIMYVNHFLKLDSLAKRDYKGFARAYIKGKIQLYDEYRITGLFKRHMKSYKETGIEEILNYSERYMHKSFGTEAVLSVGKAVEYARSGVSGIINVMPFTCMPGTITSVIMKKVREDYNNLPSLTLVYDGTEDTNMRTRLEAFMYQTGHGYTV
ncbi:MAG: acyl-CoA dehydratase activase [Nitrospinota bacterium]